ncbi:MAG: Trk system potassium transporter TrkA [Acidobacteria bacterium]|nr:MAG: Trk system potassium transporter TrkA [Acidobacteriota bacterium]
MRLIIVGGGEVGHALARALSPDHDVFVIDHNPAVGDRFASLDVEFLPGSGTSLSVLRKAGVERSQLFVACTGQDEVNVVACALANQIGSPETICLVSREDFLGADGGSALLREHFGIDRVLWPEAQLAADIVRIIEAPGAIDAEEFLDGRVRLLEYRLEERSPLCAGPLATMHLPRGALVVAVKRGDQYMIPRGSSRLLPGDKVFLMGHPEPMRMIQSRLVTGRPARDRQSVTIVGGGDVGLRIAQQLDRSPDIDLRVIESNSARGEMLAATLSRALVLNGDGTDLELLEAEEIGRSDVLVSVIDNDERNLFASLIGRQLGVRKIITRVSKAGSLRLFERVGVDVPLSARGAAVASIVYGVKGGRSRLLAVLEEGQAEILELAVPAGFVSTPLMDLQAPPDSIVGAIRRGDEVIVPHGDDRIEGGDTLIVFTTAASADQVRDFFGPPAD